MPIGFRCTGCRSRLHVPKRWSGNSLSCPNCGTRVVVPAAVHDHHREPASTAFEDAAVEHSLAALQVPAGPQRGGSFADESFTLPPAGEAGAVGGIRGRGRSDITLSRWTLYAYAVVVPVIAVVAFLLGCWWSAAGGR